MNSFRLFWFPNECVPLEYNNDCLWTGVDGRSKQPVNLATLGKS